MFPSRQQVSILSSSFLINKRITQARKSQKGIFYFRSTWRKEISAKSYFWVRMRFGCYSFIHMPIFPCHNKQQISKILLTVFSFVIAQRLTRSEKQLGDELSQNVFDSRFLLLLNARLTFHVMNEKIRGIFKNRLVFVGEDEMGPGNRFAIVPLISL